MNTRDGSKPSTEPYKGVRDFYPSDMAIQKHMFEAMRKTAELFGYVEYNASVLEPTELYKAKSGQEIVNEQTYSFKDRGDRDVTLRPEMTPTVARMVAARKRELGFPLRWYSIPNLFRYEKPQRGRLREHFQLNVDVFGIADSAAETELITLGSSLMKELGATTDMFVIKINNRKILTSLFEDVFKLSAEEATDLRRLVDKKNKMSADEFSLLSKKILHEKNQQFLDIMAHDSFDAFAAALSELTSEKLPGVEETEKLIGDLQASGITNVQFDPTLARGFDYYTGIVFEFFDIDPANPRSLFGGGRYDDLLSIFGSETLPAVGFGLGDVTLQDFLETHNLLPEYISSTQIYICQANSKSSEDESGQMIAIKKFSNSLSQDLRRLGVNVAVDMTSRKIADQIRTADKQKIPFVLVIGEDEAAGKPVTLKELSSGAESSFKNASEIASFIKNKK